MTECDLKPCPFCGHEPMFGKVRPGTRKHPPLFGITCIHCGTEMTGEFIDELIRQWNTRVAVSASIDKMEAEIQHVMEQIPNALRMLEDS